MSLTSSSLMISKRQPSAQQTILMNFFCHLNYSRWISLEKSQDLC
jgi:hypothetical protein